MDRIDSMTHEELKAATRAYISASKKWLPMLSPDKVDLRAALAAFDPAPMDVAKAALEKAGFVKADPTPRSVAITEGNGRGLETLIWYALKESP